MTVGQYSSLDIDELQFGIGFVLLESGEDVVAML
jgi:hypothetical protein